MTTPQEDIEISQYGRILDDYERGWIDAVDAYAIWDNGVQYVGALRRPKKDVVKNFLIGRDMLKDAARRVMEGGTAIL